MKKGHKIVIVGAASTEVLELISQLDTQAVLKEVNQVVLYDDDPNVNLIYAYLKNQLQTTHDLELILESALEQALTDADYVLSYIGIKVTEEDVKDEALLYDYNMFSSDLYGLKSIFKAIKVIPKLYHIIDQMNTYAEHAWLINLAQPMGLISESVIRYAEIEKYIGISHVPQDLNVCFANVLNTKPELVIPYAVGVSPMTYVTSVFQNKKDHIVDILKHRDQKLCLWSEDFLNEMGVFPSQDLNMVYYLEDVEHRFFKAYQDRQTPLQVIYHKQQTIYEKLRHNEAINDLEATEPQQVVQLLKSLILDIRDYQIVNTINNGQVEDLEDGCAVEVTSRITKDGPIPVRISRLPLQIKGYLQHLKTFEQLFADGIYLKDLNKISLATKLHPMYHNMRKIDQIFNQFQMMNEHKLKTYYKR